MTRYLKYTFIAVLVAATLACGLISNPLSQAQNLASTAESMATSMPIQTLEALPSAMPDVSGYMNPTGQPVSNWNQIPIMPGATAGQEFNKNTYSFKTNSAVADIQTFYNTQLKTLGWTSSFSAQGGTQGSQGGETLFTMGTSLLAITIAPASDNNGSVVILLLQ